MTQSARVKDITGQTYNKLTASRYVKSNSRGDALWEFACSCGNTTITRASSVRAGGIKSCGCAHIAQAKSLMIAMHTTHGRSGTREHLAWKNMLSRCNNRNNIGFCNYGGRGIKVCDRWKSFDNFLDDMGEAPKGMTLERKDVNGDYSPSNCVWATRKQQAINRRTSLFIERDGSIRCLKGWAEYLGLPYKTVHRRIASGWSIDRALTTPVGG